MKSLTMILFSDNTPLLDGAGSPVMDSAALEGGTVRAPGGPANQVRAMVDGMR